MRYAMPWLLFCQEAVSIAPNLAGGIIARASLGNDRDA